MEIKNNSIIHTVRDYALEQFGVELTDEQISADLRDLNFSGTLQLTTALKTNDNDLFTKYITLDLDEGYTVLPSMDKERYQERNGLEGPFMLRSGKVVYYDATEGLYYDPDTDYYMSYEEYAQHDKDSRMQEMQSPGVVANLKNERDDEEQLDEMLPIIGAIGRVALGLTVRSLAGKSTPATTTTPPKDGHPSALSKTSSDRYDESKKFVSQMTPAEKKEHDARRKEYNAHQKSQRNEETIEERKVAGAPGGNAAYGSDTVSTGRTTSTDPDDVQQDANSDASASNADAVGDNASAIEKLKKLAGLK